MTEAQAKELAKMDRAYVAKQKHGIWGVWDCKSDHWVEFDEYPTEDGDRLVNYVAKAVSDDWSSRTPRGPG